MAVVDEAISPELTPLSISVQYPEEDAEIEREETVLKMAVAKPLFAFGVKDLSTFKTPLERAKHGISVTILNKLMFADSSDFYNKLYDQGLISDSFEAGFDLMRACAFNAIIGESETPEAVWQELCLYLEQIKQEPPAKEDFERIKRTMYADYIRGFESTESIASELMYNAMNGIDYLQYGELILSVTYEEIVALAKHYYENKHFAKAIILPIE